MSVCDNLFGPDPFQKQMWLDNADMRQAMLERTTSDKSVPELIEAIKVHESQIESLTEPQESIIETWACAVARIKETPFVEFYMLKCGPCQLLEFAESYFRGDPPIISTDIQKQYYYEEKLEVLRNVTKHGTDYLKKYQEMIENIRTYIGKEAKSSVWERWDNNYAVRKMIRWIREWKGIHLS